MIKLFLLLVNFNEKTLILLLILFTFITNIIII